MDSVITRFAPSPTGYLHIGGVRTALINYIYTKQKNKNSKFLLRIEDTDKKRSKNEYIDSIISGLKWLGIEWNDKIYFQSHKLNRHQEIAKILLKNNFAFKCICTKEEIDERRKNNIINKKNIKRICVSCENDEKIQNTKENFCIRLKIPDHGSIKINDLIQGEIKINNNEIDNYIILRNDGSPTYMLSVVVDDHDMNVNTIIRGNDHFNNSFRHAYVYNYLNWKVPEYAHLPLIHANDGTKLSKRHGAIDINEFMKIGFIPKSIINSLILLGWSPNKVNEVIEIEEIINKFNIANISKSSSIFDYKKLDFFNNFYINKEKSNKIFEDFIKTNTSISKYFNYNNEKVLDIYNAHKYSVKRLNEFVNIIAFYFDEKFVTKQSNLLDQNFKNLLKKFLVLLKKIEIWNEKNIDECIRYFITSEKIKFVDFGKPLRYLITNQKEGISLSLIIFLLEKKKVLLRITNYLNK